MENPYSKSLDTNIHFWEQYRLPEKSKWIKESMETVVKSQEASVRSRKELATKTKEIKNVASGERLNYMKSLLKLYQEEIDHLTVRSQFAENLLSSYASDLNGLLDPISILQQSKNVYQQYAELITQSEVIDTENNNLRHQIQQLQSQQQHHLNAESEASILRDKITELESQNKSLQTKLTEKENENESQKQSLSSNSSVHEENIRLQLQIATLTKEINEYYSVTSTGGKDAENQLISQQVTYLREELDKTQQELAHEQEKTKMYVVTQKEYEENNERRIEGYESQITLLNEEIESQQEHIKELEIQVKDKNTMVNPSVIHNKDDNIILIGDLRKTIAELKQIKDKSDAEWTEKEKQWNVDKEQLCSTYEKQINDLNNELRLRVTVDEMNKIKTILVTLQHVGIPVEFNEIHELPIPDVEKVLLDKIHHLETSNSNLRSTFNDIYNKYMISENCRHTIEEKLNDAEDTIKGMESQIAELEQRVIGKGRNGNQAMGNNNVETILKDQRDRYKRRVDELESERSQDKASLDSLYSVVSKLKRELNEKKGPSTSYFDNSSSNKYHMSDMSSNPLEKVSFKIAKEMIKSERFRYVVSMYIVIIHFLLVLLIIHYSMKS